jgi:hypothetical protein
MGEIGSSVYRQNSAVADKATNQRHPADLATTVALPQNPQILHMMHQHIS